MKYDFLSSWYDQSTNAQRVDHIDSLLSFIRTGIPTWIADSGFDEFKDAVHLHIHTKIWPPMNASKPLAACGDTDALLIEHIRSANIWHGPFQLAEMPLPSTVNTALDTFQMPKSGGGNGFLDVAFDMTFNNLARAQTRIILVHALPFLLSARSGFAGSDNLLRAFYAQSNQFQRNLLLFGVMLGGEKQKRAIQHVAPQTVYSKGRAAKFSVINHLTIDGHIPGYYFSELTEGLESEINAAMEKLE